MAALLSGDLEMPEKFVIL